MIIVKSKDEIRLMARAGEVTAEMLEELAAFIRPGISTEDIDRWCERFIESHGMKPAFKGYGGFPASACVSVNEEVVHGIPSKKRLLREGDIVSVDVGTIYKDYYSDAARTYPVGEISSENARLIRVAEESFFAGMRYAKSGNRIGDIACAVQRCVEKAGFSVIRDYAGHGVGRDLHEDPAVPNYGRAGHGPKLQSGMVIAVEPMIAVGAYDVEVLPNNWTAVTKDGSFAAHYENTVVITEDEPILLTRLENLRNSGLL